MFLISLYFDRRTRAYLAKVASGQAINDTTVVHTLQQDICFHPATGHGGRGHSSDLKERGKTGAVSAKLDACTERPSLSSVENLDAESRAARQDNNKREKNGGHIPVVEAGPTSHEARTNSCNVRSVRLPANMADVKTGFPKPESEKANSAPTRNSYGGEGRAPDGNEPPLPFLSALPMGRRSAKNANGKAHTKIRKGDDGVPSQRRNRRKEGIFSPTDRSAIATDPRTVQLPILVR